MILRNCCVPLFVAMASVHDRVLAEHVLDRAPQRLDGVDHGQDRVLGIEATVDEVREQRPRQGRVLGIRIPGLRGRVLPEPCPGTPRTYDPARTLPATPTPIF